ncbi:MAG: phosphate acyltransferase PlsX [Pseudomonadota bacterium]
MDGASPLSENASQSSSKTGAPIVVSVDAMGGDQGADVIVRGLAKAASRNPDLRFVLHGPEAELASHVAKRKIGAITTIRDAQGVVMMEDKPSHVMRNGKGTSMWSAIEAVRSKEADVCVSCGNTGALMAVAMLRLRKLPGVNRPAIAVLWPSDAEKGFNVLLDAGADIRADEVDLMQYALMGASYARNGLEIERPRVGLLNVGTEEHKGRAELKVASELIAAQADAASFDYVGFVEGGQIASKTVDVVVTDGFTGNIALKTGEGTASFISASLRDAFRHTPLSRLAALMALTSLRRLRHRIDPRRVNGGVFLGLNGTVVKSHGSADATGVAAAIKLAYQLSKSGYGDRLAARVAHAEGFPSQEDRQ